MFVIDHINIHTYMYNHLLCISCINVNQILYPSCSLEGMEESPTVGYINPCLVSVCFTVPSPVSGSVVMVILKLCLIHTKILLVLIFLLWFWNQYLTFLLLSASSSARFLIMSVVGYEAFTRHSRSTDCSWSSKNMCGFSTLELLLLNIMSYKSAMKFKILWVCE